METTFKDRLKKALAASGMRASQLAAATGLSKARISQYINGIYVPKSQAAFLIARALNVSEAWLIGEGGPMRSVKSAPPHGKVSAIPLFESLEDALIENSGDKILEHIPPLIKDFDPGSAFAWRVCGDEMAPKIEDGDLIIAVRREKVESGNISIVRLNGKLSIKTVELADDKITLKPLNGSLPGQVFEGSETEKVEFAGRIRQIIKYV